MVDFKEDVEICLSEKLKSNDEYAVDFYRAICNMRWRKGESVYSCTWRYAGEFIARLRDQGEDYLDFYCSGGEGRVSNEVELDLQDLGWMKFEWETEDDEDYSLLS